MSKMTDLAQELRDIQARTLRIIHLLESIQLPGETKPTDDQYQVALLLAMQLAEDSLLLQDYLEVIKRRQ